MVYLRAPSPGICWSISSKNKSRYRCEISFSNWVLYQIWVDFATSCISLLVYFCATDAFVFPRFFWSISFSSLFSFPCMYSLYTIFVWTFCSSVTGAGISYTAARVYSWCASLNVWICCIAQYQASDSIPVLEWPEQVTDIVICKGQ